MSDNYSENRPETISTWYVKAICPTCERRWWASAEDAIGLPNVNDIYEMSDLCSECDDEHPDIRGNEW